MFALMGVLVQGMEKLIGEGYRHNVYPQENEESGVSVGIHCFCLTQKPHLFLNDTINSNELKSPPPPFTHLQLMEQ